MKQVEDISCWILDPVRGCNKSLPILELRLVMAFYVLMMIWYALSICSISFYFGSCKGLNLVCQPRIGLRWVTMGLPGKTIKRNWELFMLVTKIFSRRSQWRAWKWSWRLSDESEKSPDSASESRPEMQYIALNIALKN